MITRQGGAYASQRGVAVLPPLQQSAVDVASKRKAAAKKGTIDAWAQVSAWLDE